MTDFDKYLKDRVIIISGVGRSGTTILGKVIGSTKNTFYFFEPAIMKYLPYVYTGCFHAGADEESRVFIKQAYLGTLFEDYILPSIQGRNLNYRKNDWSYIYNYQYKSDIIKRQSLDRRQDVLEYIEQNNPYFIFKVNDASHLFWHFTSIFKGLRLIYIYRNGFDTVMSMVERGWFQDNFNYIDLVYGMNIPFYVGLTDRDRWNDWNVETKAAYTWYYMNEVVERLEPYASTYENYIKLNYDELCKSPAEMFQKISNKFNLVETPLTEKHIQSIIDFKRSRRPMLDIAKIEKSVRHKFLEMNIRLGYANEN